MQDSRRRPWTEEDSKALMDYWDTLGSVFLISLATNRSRSSVQTQASRLGLGARPDAEPGRHRRRWRAEDDQLLADALAAATRPDGTIPVQALARSTGRNIDAIVARLEARYGADSDIIGRLVSEVDLQTVCKVPRTQLTDQSETPRQRRKGNQPGDDKCLCCGRIFQSEGPGNRICARCKRDPDWEYDGW